MAGPKKKSAGHGGAGRAAGGPGTSPLEPPRIVVASPFSPPTPLPGEELMFDLTQHGPRGKAQRLMYDAWEKTIADGTSIANQALEIDPDCADALLFKSLAAGAQGDLNTAVELVFEAVEAGERSLADTNLLDEGDGRLWGYLPARPYLRARYFLARLLWDTGSRVAAAAVAGGSLDLDSNDSLGVRYLLLSWYLDMGERAYSRELLDDYKKDGSALFLYGDALLTFWEEGSTNTSRARLRKAFKANAFVPDLMLDMDDLDQSEFMDVSLYSPGDENEGLICAALLQVAWDRDPEATDWLIDAWEKYQKRHAGS